MFSLNTQQQQPSNNSRHFPANQSLNKNADGFVCCINITHSDITKTRIERKPPKTNSSWGAQPQQQSGFFGQSAAPATGGGGGLFGASNPQGGGGLFGGGANNQQQQQPQTGGLFGGGGGGLFSQQQQQPAQTGGLFGSTTPQQPQTGGGGGLFGASTFGQPQQQQQPQQQGGLFGATTTTNTGGGLFGGQSTTPATGGGLFGQSTTPAAGSGGGLFSSQPQQGGLFGSSQPQQQQGGLFGSQPQTQQGGLFGGLAANTANQQRTLFGQTSQPMGMNTPQYPIQQTSMQQPQYIIVQQPSQDYQLNVNFDFDDELEQQHLREIEDNFRSGLPSFTDRRTSLYEHQPKKININIKTKEKTSRLLGRTSQLPSRPSSTIHSTLGSSLRSQTQSLHSQTLPQSSILRKSNIMQPAEFLVTCTLNSLDQQLNISLLKLGLKQDNTVRQLKKALLDQFFSSSEQKKLKNVVMIENTNRVSKVRSDDETLHFIKRDTNITLFEGAGIKEEEEVIAEQEEGQRFNPNCPRINDKDLMQCIPPIEDLQYLSDEQLAEVENFQILTDYGSVQFLQPVDLRKLDLDKAIVFHQDSVDFYPESDGYELPQEGDGLNVRCMITFENFGNGSRKMRELRNEDYDMYCEKVKKWADSLDMKVRSVERNGKVVVELDKI